MKPVMAMPLLEHSWRSPPLTFFLSEADVPVNTNESRKAASKTNVIGERRGHAASQTSSRQEKLPNRVSADLTSLDLNVLDNASRFFH